ncbi:MAG: sigma-54 dependent transcriptional regulator [Thermodesulfobacteriota bacterium]|nr:sigma-54 dependent transcriptional regulator [Thermodesulfobacteriota bacterium]
MHNKRILVVDDEENVRKLLFEVLTKERYNVNVAESAQKALDMLVELPIDLVLMDIRMPGMDGIEAFHIIRENYPKVTVIMMTAFVSIDTAVEAMKMGAYNYISKPFDISEIKVTVKRALEIQKLTEEVRDLRHEIQNEFSISNIIGKSDKMKEVYKIIGRVADSYSNVLIHGESGTGKELIARAIHYNSQRKNNKFVKVNCGALPENLLESEIFGYEKGAFTGAGEMKTGKFEYASGGSVFLDEISEMSPNLQVKLLRIIQEKEFERLGGLDPIKSDVRIIAATNRNLKKLVKLGDFRKDMFYRLSVVSIYLPPLRERKEDIPLLTEYFLNKYNKEMNKRFNHISQKAMRLLMAYDWPGNVRELENAIERAMVLGSGAILLPENLLLDSTSFSGQEVEILYFEDKSLRQILQEVEKKVLNKVLKRNGWNKARTARKMKMSRQALLYKIEKYNIEKNR